MDQPIDQTSVQLRLRRITIEDSYISVPILPEMLEPDGEGKYNINSEKFMEIALHLANTPKLSWKVEEITVEPHPIQGRMPADRTSFRPILD